MKLKNHWLVVTALLLLSMLMAACGGTPVAQPTSAPEAPTTTSVAEAPATTPAATPAVDAVASAEPIELRVAWWGSQNRTDRTLKVIDLFQQAHPNIIITAEYGNYDDHWTKLATQAAGGNLPDVVQHDYSRIGDWVSRDLLLPLDPFVESGVIALEGVTDEQLSAGRINDQLYGVSLGTNALTVLYDRAMFEAAGVPPPTPEWTWSDFKEVATNIHESLGIYGVEGFYNMEFFKIFLKEHGQWIYSADGKSLGYEDDALAAEFFQMLLDMQESGAMPSREFDAARGTPALEDSLIVSEQAAMLFIWSNQAVAVANAAGDRRLELVQTPSVASDSEGLYLKPSMFFSIPTQARHPDAAALFIDFFLNSPEANEILAAERGVPIVPAVREAIEASVSPIQKQIFQYISEVEKVAAPVDPPDPPVHGKLLADVYNPLIDQLLYGELSPEEAAAQLRDQATTILASQ